MSEEDVDVGTSNWQEKRLLQVPKIGAKAAQALLSNGYTLEKLATAVPSDIVKILQCKPMMAKTVIINAQTVLEHDAPPPGTATQYEAEMKARVQRIMFPNCPSLNDLLGGGYKTLSTAGVSGPQSTGKSQMANDLILEVINDMTTCKTNDPKICENACAIEFETELNTFSPDRLRGMAQATGRKYDPDRILIVPATRIRDVGTQYYQYQKAYELAKARKMNIKLIVVDSLNSLFQRKYSGREMLPDRKQELARHLSFLEDMAKEFNALVFCTCQVIESPVNLMEARGAFSSADVRAQFGTNYMVWGGHILRHTLGTWTSVCQTTTKDTWKIVLFDSSELPKDSRLFKISAIGIEDADLKGGSGESISDNSSGIKVT